MPTQSASTSQSPMHAVHWLYGLQPANPLLMIFSLRGETVMLVVMVVLCVVVAVLREVDVTVV